MTRAQIRQVIRRMAKKIADRFDPDRIILFGSHARNDADVDSDVDLLVVMAIDGSKQETQVALRLAVREFKIAKDVIVTTPQDFEWRKEIPGTIERPAALEGRVLYART